MTRRAPDVLLAIALCASLGLSIRPAKADVARLDRFGRLPVQEGGRVMPMDSFARQRLLQFSGRSTYGGKPAVDWLAHAVFEPDRVLDSKIFLVNNPEVLEAIDVKVDGRRYSFGQLRDGAEKLHKLAEAAQQHEEGDRSPVEKEILRIYQNLAMYAQLTGSFQFALPAEDFAVTNEALRARMQLPPEAQDLSFLDAYLGARDFGNEVEKISKTRPETWTAEQGEMFQLSTTLFQWSQFYRGSPIAMLPLQAHGGQQWVSPWDLLAFGFLDDTTRGDLASLQEMAQAYVLGRQVEFDLAAHAFEHAVLSRAAPSRSLNHSDLELLYNRLEPFYRAEVVYGFAFLLCLLSMMGNRPLLRRLAVAGVLLALVPHTAGLVWRMMIMGRPPMTNLYATFIFVSWVCVVLGLAIEWFQRNSLGTLLASIAGLALLMVSSRFAAQGDTLGVVVAVLDSNFWLSTHVVAITTGYAGCIAAGLVGHVYLLQAIWRSPDDPRLAATARAVYGLTAFGLIFSFLGTMLGGVWADQSWGRFWGWDPKENGALLIVLWCSVLFHSRVAKLIGPLGFAAGSVLGVIVVLMAWIGINLLGVGLHSYGFTSGLALGMSISIAVEILFVAVTVPLILRRAPDGLAVRT